uniref:hypothetical protein n=1 Tax=Paracoccus binzhouensis TaxID=2796149 RepID=UPI001E5B5E2C
LDRWGYYAILAVAFLVVPLVIDSYWANAVCISAHSWQKISAIWPKCRCVPVSVHFSLCR